MNIDLTFEAGDTRVCFDVTTLTDDVLEDPEQLRLTLVQTEDRMTFDPRTTIVEILDDRKCAC